MLKKRSLLTIGVAFFAANAFAASLEPSHPQPLISDGFVKVNGEDYYTAGAEFYFCPDAFGKRDFSAVVTTAKGSQCEYRYSGLRPQSLRISGVSAQSYLDLKFGSGVTKLTAVAPTHYGVGVYYSLNKPINDADTMQRFQMEYIDARATP